MFPDVENSPKSEHMRKSCFGLFNIVFEGNSAMESRREGTVETTPSLPQKRRGNGAHRDTAPPAHGRTNQTVQQGMNDSDDRYQTKRLNNLKL